MKKGQLITGVLVAFTYVGSDVKYCRVSVKDDKGVIHKALAGTHAIYDFATMMSLKGAGASVSMKYDGQHTPEGSDVAYDRYNEFEFSLA